MAKEPDWDRMYQVAISSLRRWPTLRDPEDAALKAVEALFVRLRNGQNVKSFEAFVRAVAFRSAWIQERNNFRAREIEFSDLELLNIVPISREMIEPETLLLQKEWSEAINQILLRTLTPDEHTLFTLRFIDDKNYNEISQQLGISYAVARKRMSRIIMKLRRAMREWNSD